MSFFGELRRRNVVKVAVAYAIVGWLLIEVAATILPISEAPAWILQVFTLFVILGFPIALLLSWAYELTPEGVKRSREVEATESITQVTGRKIDFAIIGALVLALGFVVYNYVLQDGADESPEVAVVGSEQAILPNSVAVLPFENLSLDPEDAFFAAGIHEEVLNQLVKLSELNVIARTSMMQYADGEKSIPQVAEELNVETVMEGSVRYADGRVLVTAQLIDPATNAHLWSESYNREFADVFAIQSDIAMNIANALEAEFSLEEQASIEKIPTASPEAYRHYLSAVGLPIQRWSLSDQYLNEAIALDPDFAPAYAEKAFIYAFEAPTADWQVIALENAERSLALDPTLGMAYVALGTLYRATGQWAQAQEAFEEAYDLGPNDADILFNYALLRRELGQYNEALVLNERAVQLNPSDPGLLFQLGASYKTVRNYPAAAAAAREAITLNPTPIQYHVLLGQMEAARGNLAEALRELEIARQLELTPIRFVQMAIAYWQLDRQEDVSSLVDELEQIHDQTPLNDAVWAMAYLALGDHEQALVRLENAVNLQFLAGNFSFNSFRIPFNEIKSNYWGDPVLDEDARFVDLRERIFAVE